MEWVETTGKTLEEAEEAALDQLGIGREDAEFEIIEEPRTGLFGRLRGEARVRARVAPKAPRPKHDRRHRRRSRGAPSDDTLRQQHREPVASGDARGAKKRRVKTKGGRPVTDHDRGGSRPSNLVSEGGKASATSPADDTRPALTLEEEGELVASFLDGLTDAFGLDATVSAKPIDEDTVQVDVSGDQLGLLVGPRGRTLAAVQELSRTILQRTAVGGFHGRVKVDIGGYRARREEALSRFAAKAASQAVETGKPVALEPMTPPDRKIVHDAVNEIAGVTTRSEGDEPRRYVVITPVAVEADV